MLVLASTSKYRAKLLSRLNLPHLSAPPICDESAGPNESPQQLAERLAHEKAQSLSNDYPKHLIIGSDQVAALGSQLLGKPGSHANAVAQLSAMQGKTVAFYTAVCVINGASGESVLHTDTTRVKLRPLDTPAIERYLLADKPYDCAGSFKVESLGISLFEWVRNEDPTALEGLPLIGLAKLLRQLGVQLP